MISPHYRSSNRQERDQGVRREEVRGSGGTGGQGRRRGEEVPPFELTNVENWEDRQDRGGDSTRQEV